jgi:pimeloyl-ACP methyl ester carboxylesterase
MRISLGDVSLWFGVSGPSVIPQGDTTVERPVLVAVHGGPGLDHMTVKSALEPLAGDFQVLYFDLRGHGRSDRSSAESWNMRTWADDLRRLYSATPGWAEESRRFLARMIKNPDVAAHYASHEVPSFDPWSLTGAVRCPVLVLAGEDDPVCPLPVVEELATRAKPATAALLPIYRGTQARPRIHRTRPYGRQCSARATVAQIGVQTASRLSIRVTPRSRLRR